MKSLALVVGNADYPKTKAKDFALENSVNDAQDVGTKLVTLGYDVVRRLNCTQIEFHEALADFGGALLKDSYEVGLFYFAGHGIQIDGLNYLTAIDSNFFDRSSLKHSSIKLDQLIDTMQSANPRIKILILDACRDNPFPNEFRSGVVTSGLAPIKAPKGTIIAFSTSPGDKAKDSGMGRNSYYTGSLLKHIDDRNIPIEDVFKRVRTSVYSLTKGGQTSWEHTSLIGNYYFNYGQRTHSLELPYRIDVVEDSNYMPDDSALGYIIEELRSYNWHKQESAINRINNINLKNIDHSDFFLIGRNILQAAQGSCYAAIDKLTDPVRWMNGFSTEEKIHMINGMFYEVYFNSKGVFRGEEKLKSDYLSKLLDKQDNISYKPSFDFIRKQLLPFTNDLFFIPGNSDFILAIEVRVIPSEFAKNTYKVTSIKYQEIELLHETHFRNEYTTIKTYKTFREELINKFHIPAKQVRIVMDINETDISEVQLPYFYEITRDPKQDILEF